VAEATAVAWAKAEVLTEARPPARSKWVASVAAVEVAPTTAVMEAATAAAEVEAAAASNLYTQTRLKARPHQGTQICTRHRRWTMVSSALLEFALEIRSYAFLMSSESRSRP
jgi:hypothetical protein